MKKRILCALLTLLMCLPVLTGCKKTLEPVEFTTFAMDTVMSFTLYGEEEPISSLQLWIPKQLGTLESMLSVTREDSDISKVNRAGGQPVELCDYTAGLLSQALELCEVTDGALDITAYPAVKAWGFTTEEHRVPSSEELAELAKSIDYTAVKLEENILTLPESMEIDLGAVAKGYVGDCLLQAVQDSGVTSALLNLGQSTIITVGSKPDGSPWRVGVQDPNGEGYIGVVELAGMAMGTSGGYQRFFEVDGVTYWHILDPATAAPARSGVTSVTVVAPSGLICDGLSTALFVMGLEEGTRFWRTHPELEFEVIFVTEDGAVFYTAGLKDCFTWEDETREVTVLE